MRTIYFDESEIFMPSNFLGYATLTTEEPITNVIVDEAMRNLKNDPDIKLEKNVAMDSRTLKNGYFHASFDSKNAHSHLCNSINKFIDGSFVSEHFDTTKNKMKTYSETLEHASHLASMSPLNTREKISVYFEKRGNLSKTFLKNSFKNFYDTLHWEAFQTPSIPTFYPELIIDLSDKADPGIQCVDFILWTVGRYINNKKDWLSRISNKMFTESYPAEEKNWINIHIDYKNGIKYPISYYKFEDLPKDPDSIVNNELLSSFFLNALKMNGYYSENLLPEGIEYIRPMLKDIHNSIYDIKKINFVENVIKNFLFLFDMVPLINSNTSQNEKEFLLLSKKYLGLALRTDLRNGVSTNDYYRSVRRHFIDFRARG